MDSVAEIIAAGHRYSNTHTAGDASLDETMDSIERESARLGMSIQQIRAMRHTVDHCTMNPRPDQIPRLRELGMMISCSPKRIPNAPPIIAKEYGEAYTKWIIPMRGLIDGGVMPSIEIDEGGIHNKGYFFYLDMVVNRLSNDGRVYNPEERIDRVEALKAATIWAAHYVMREDRIGSLEPGKHADFLVLDKPYFDTASVPNEKIKTVRPLMTVVGERMSYLDAGFAKELGMEPMGNQPEGVISAIAQWEEHGWPLEFDAEEGMNDLE
jgi:predicted amidohydrolase YtcJ